MRWPSLNDRTRHVLEARFGLGNREPATLEQVGAEIGVTRERVRQIETRALRELESKPVAARFPARPRLMTPRSPWHTTECELATSFWHATGVFSDRLTDVRLGALALAVAFGVSNLLLRSTAWRNILAAAHPGIRVRWRSITGGYLAGAAVNAVVPARGGDVTKIYLAHRSIPGSAYTTVTSSLIAETLIDLVIGPALLIAAYSTGPASAPARTSATCPPSSGRSSGITAACSC